MNERLNEPLFYCETLNDSDELVLTGEEAHHVTVQRRRIGEAIALFDGHGAVARGTIGALERNQVRVRVEERRREPPPAPALELYCALPKGDRVAVLLDMATQLGISRFTPIAWRRSVNAPGPRASERWRRICLEACKQSRRLHLPEIASSSTADAAVQHAKAAGTRILVAHLRADARPLSAIDLTRAARIGIFVGPEGGLTDEEVAALSKENVDFVDLGPAILRIETAAIALLAAVSCTAPRRGREPSKA
ncbi:MAG: RsmE family RNA methyltransferase [Sulfurifustaceae bacterium]